jgi:hypothetical protein
MQHVPNTRNQPQHTLGNLLMNPDCVSAMFDYAVICACHDHYGHLQFPIAALHRAHCRNHRGGILSLGADLRWS